MGRASLGGSAPFISVSLKLAGTVVSSARFEAQGCGYTIACCSVLTEIVSGRRVAEVARLVPADILRELAGVPLHRQFCATLAIEALGDALRQLPGELFLEIG